MNDSDGCHSCRKAVKQPAPIDKDDPEPKRFIAAARVADVPFPA